MTSKIWIGLGAAMALAGTAGAAYGIMQNNEAAQDSNAARNQSQSASVNDIAAADDPMTLDIIARIGPWPYASRLIGYRGRLWFANSVKYRNHNSADIWSMDPQSGEMQLERNLFSQDAGTPVIYNDLLYWPHEDALLAGGTGEVSATNGTDWAVFNIQSALMYHTSELIDFDGKLLAVTGARNAGLQITSDGGQSWSELYDHSAPRTHIARIKDMTRLTIEDKSAQDINAEYFATLRDKKTQRLVKWNGSGFDTISSFPVNRPIRGLTAHDGALYAIIGRGEDAEIWQSNGKTSKNLGRKGNFIDIASNGTRLWALTHEGDLFSAEDGNWQKHNSLKGGKPTSIEVIDGAIYAAGAGEDGHGIIWGPKVHKITGASQKIAPFPPPITIPSIAIDWEELGQRIDNLLSDPSAYQGYNNGELSALLDRSVTMGAPAGFFAKRLNANIPDIGISVFSANRETKALDLAYAHILRSMERSGQTGVPTKLLTVQWTAQPNSYEKYLARPLMALKTIAATGQNDEETIAALIARLDYKDDPDWLRSHVIGTLTAVTNQRFGYDTAAWKAWHKS